MAAILIRIEWIIITLRISSSIGINKIHSVSASYQHRRKRNQLQSANHGPRRTKKSNFNQMHVNLTQFPVPCGSNSLQEYTRTAALVKSK